MKRIKSLLRRFPAKVTLALICAMVLVLLLSNYLIYTFTLKAQFESLRDGLMTLARTAGLMIDADQLLKVPLKKEGIHSSEFQSIQRIMKRIKVVNPQIKFLYTMTKTEKNGIWQFMVDADTRLEGVENEALESYPGNRYEAFRFPEMMKAFDGPSADTRLEIDEWGATLSGYAPIYDHGGQAVAILGIDIDAGDVYQIQIEAQRRMRSVLAFGFALSLFLGVMFARRITDPVVRLVEGTRRIGKGDLQYRVVIKGEDEVSELARSFNLMARNLYKSRRRILTYFFNIVRTLVRVLEARDMYTKGHSQAVADYAAKIAVKMGINQEDTKMFKKMVVLHDIGKIGIEDKILNKPGKLTDEEWEKIKKHPEIGEEILKPVIDDKDLLAVVRAHHERYDGQGYPDKLEKNEINIFAAIVAVADAYHAMTSDRPYRKAMNRDEAIEELRKNKGTQFHPKVVDVFLQILEEEN